MYSFFSIPFTPFPSPPPALYKNRFDYLQGYPSSVSLCKFKQTHGQIYFLFFFLFYLKKLKYMCVWIYIIFLYFVFPLIISYQKIISSQFTEIFNTLWYKGPCIFATLVTFVFISSWCP